MLNATTKVAFAAYLHDLGKFAERARMEVGQEKLESHIQLYCPKNFEKGFYTHKHAAYTALAWDIIEQHVPDLVRGDMYPFVGRQNDGEITDSLFNASAMHHKPETFMQWIIATADRVASGFEREEFERYNQAQEQDLNPQGKTGKNHYQARLLTQFEQIRLNNSKIAGALSYCYPLKPLSAQSIFPQKRDQYEPSENSSAQAEYQALWQGFLQDLEHIPASHRQNWTVWLDHFDTLWQTYTQAIPSATAFNVKPDVSLYDHSKTTAALAAALWRWHEAEEQTDDAAAAALKSRSDWDEEKILLIQGDFFGIQNFIFSDGSQTNKRAAKILRGRSFQVSLFAELAALKVLQACDLPAVSQILNAAGKFMIVAPNTAQVRAAVEQVREEINQWFIRETFGQVGLGLAVQAASCNDFIDKQKFASLVKKSFSVLETSKLQRFKLADSDTTVLPADYRNGVCAYNHHLSAEKDGMSRLSADQILLGSLLTKEDRLMIMLDGNEINDSSNTRKLSLPVFGLHIAFTAEEDTSGKFGAGVKNGNILRFWDFSLPENLNETPWHGYARRYINAYIPRFSETNEWESDKYQAKAEDEEAVRIDNPKTFNHLACEERQLAENGKYQGKIAIATLKGDVDNLGTIFQKGLQAPTFAKMAALSRQMNHFFSLWLPAYCAEHARNTYTVFAGGDDFFLIGPWLQTQKLAAAMREAFGCYVAHNPGITFSAGIAVSKAGLPLNKLSAYAEEALETAKAHTHEKGSKDSICLYGETIAWHEWPHIQTAFEQIDQVKADYGLSTGLVYGMLYFGEEAAKERAGNIEAGMWRSRLAYRLRRYVQDNKHISDKGNAVSRLNQVFYQDGIEKLQSRYRIPLTNHFYLLRER